GRDGLPLALGGSRADAHVVDRAPGRRMRPLPDEHLSGLRPLLEACTHVDRVTRHHQLSARRRLPPGDHLAGVDPDAQADLDAVAPEGLAGEPWKAVANRESGPHSALRVVVVRERHAEDGEHRVAYELLAEPAEPFHHRVDEG